MTIFQYIESRFRQKWNKGHEPIEAFLARCILFVKESDDIRYTTLLSVGNALGLNPSNMETEEYFKQLHAGFFLHGIETASRIAKPLECLESTASEVFGRLVVDSAGTTGIKISVRWTDQQ